MFVYQRTYAIHDYFQLEGELILAQSFFDMYKYMHVCIYTHIHTYTYVYMYIVHLYIRHTRIAISN